MVTTERQLKSPVRKLIPFFQNSRDQWKARHHDVQTLLTKEQNQVWAVERSRKNWRQRAEAAEQEHARLAAEISALAVNKDMHCN